MRFNGFICGRPVAWLAVCAHQSLRPGSHRRSLFPMFYRVVTPDPDYTNTQAYTYYQECRRWILNALEPMKCASRSMGSMIPLPVRRAQAK